MCIYNRLDAQAFYLVTFVLEDFSCYIIRNNLYAHFFYLSAFLISYFEDFKDINNYESRYQNFYICESLTYRRYFDKILVSKG